MTSEAVLGKIEESITAIWGDLLGVEVGAADNFFNAGADSLLVVDFLLAARRQGLSVKAADVFSYPTAHALAARLAGAQAAPGAQAVPGGEAAPGAEAGTATATPRQAYPELLVTADEIWQTHLSPWHPDAPRCLVPLADGSGEPLYVVHWGNGAVRFARDAAVTWSAGRPVLGFEAPGYRGRVRPLTSIRDLAERYLAELLAHQPAGPYFLSGICQGAVVAYEMGRRLRERGADVTVGLVKPSTLERWLNYGWGLDDVLQFRLSSLPGMLSLTGDEDPAELFSRMRAMDWYDDLIKPAELPRLQVVWSALAYSLHHYDPLPFDGRILLFQDRKDEKGTAQGWAGMLAGADETWFDYGVESALPILNDPRVAAAMSRALAR